MGAVGRHGLPASLFEELSTHIRETGMPSIPLSLKHHLAFIDTPQSGGRARLIVIADDALRDLIDARLTNARIAPAELRLVKQLLGGYSLHEAAACDSVVYETKRSQYKSLARKLGVRSQLDLAGVLLTQIMLDLFRAMAVIEPPGFTDWPAEQE